MNWQPEDMALFKAIHGMTDELGLHNTVITLKCRAPTYDHITPDGRAWLIVGGGGAGLRAAIAVSAGGTTARQRHRCRPQRGQ